MMKNKKKGLTFIELILAVTIFSVVAVSVYSVFRAGVRLWSGTTSLVESKQLSRLFFDMISLDLKNSVYYYVKDEANFVGEPRKISFITLINVSDPGKGPHAELARVVYYYDSSSKAVRRAVATKAEGLSEDYAKASDILNNIEDKDFGFEYCYKLGSSKTEYEYEWRDTWEDDESEAGKIPRGVRVKAAGYSETIFISTGRLGGKDEV